MTKTYSLALNRQYSVEPFGPLMYRDDAENARAMLKNLTGSDVLVVNVAAE